MKAWWDRKGSQHAKRVYTVDVASEWCDKGGRDHRSPALMKSESMASPSTTLADDAVGLDALADDAAQVARHASFHPLVLFPFLVLTSFLLLSL